MVKKRIFRKVVTSSKLYNFKFDLDNIWHFVLTVLIVRLVIWGLSTSKWYWRLLELSGNIIISIFVVMVLDWIFTRKVYYEED